MGNDVGVPGRAEVELQDCCNAGTRLTIHEIPTTDGGEGLWAEESLMGTRSGSVLRRWPLWLQTLRSEVGAALRHMGHRSSGHLYEENVSGRFGPPGDAENTWLELWKDVGFLIWDDSGGKGTDYQTERQQAWLEHFSHLDQDRLRMAIRSGVPQAFRDTIWYACSGAATKRSNTEKCYTEFVAARCKLAGTEAMRVIKADAPRTGIQGLRLEALENILLAFATKNSAVGYCQSMNYVAASLLISCREETAFWVFCSLIEDLLPNDYYTSTIAGLRVDLKVLQTLLEKHIPTLAQHLDACAVDLSPILMGWFLCVFANTLPRTHSQRLLDCLVYEGSTVLFRAALALLCLWEKQLLEARCMTDVYALLRWPLTIESRQGESIEILSSDALISAMYAPCFNDLSADSINRLREECWDVVHEEDQASALRRDERSDKFPEEESPAEQLQRTSNELMQQLLGVAEHAQERSSWLSQITGELEYGNPPALPKDSRINDGRRKSSRSSFCWDDDSIWGDDTVKSSQTRLAKSKQVSEVALVKGDPVGRTLAVAAVKNDPLGHSPKFVSSGELQFEDNGARH